MIRVLLTGANGAFARAVLERLKALEGFEIIQSSRHAHRADPSVIVCDLTDRMQAEALLDLARPGLVLHLAASYSDELTEACAVNVQAANFILQAVERRGWRTRIVVIGSAAEYGRIEPADNPVSEDRLGVPVSVYGLTKSWQSQLMRFYAKRGLDVLCARIFNLDGPGLSARLLPGRLQNQIAEVLAGRQEVIELGSLDSMRDYLPMTDAAVQLLTIATRGQAGETYHVASGIALSTRRYVELQLERAGLAFEVVRERSAAQGTAEAPVHTIYADISKTQQLARTGTDRAFV